MLWNMPPDPRTQLYSFCCFLISRELTLIATKLIVKSQRDFEAMAPGNTAPGGYALKSFREPDGHLVISTITPHSASQL